ncbi:MAG: hypothetical protein SNG02_05055 [Rikenellaceae bacterium]
MKKLIGTLPLLLVALFTFTSCDDGYDWPSDEDIASQLTKTDFYGKWDLEDTYGYESIEFILDDYYFIVERDDDTEEASIIYGRYYISGSSKVVLSGFGTLEFSSWSGSSIRFTMTRNDGKTAIVSPTKIDEISLTDDTVLISTIWKTISTYYTDDNYGVEEYGYVAFTNTGTMIIIDSDGSTQLGEWAWAQEYQSGDKEIYYKFDGDGGLSDGTQTIVKFTELSLDAATIKITFANSSEWIDVTLVAYSGSISS